VVRRVRVSRRAAWQRREGLVITGSLGIAPSPAAMTAEGEPPEKGGPKHHRL
jgi:hypothetical protein